MEAIIQQLGLDQTLFYQLVVFAVLFLFLSQIYFKPFQRLIEARHRRTVEDREAAERLFEQAKEKLDSYQRRLADERASLRQELERAISEARKEETALLSQARDEAKKITQDAAEQMRKQHEQLRRELDLEVEKMALQLSDRLISRKA